MKGQWKWVLVLFACAGLWSISGVLIKVLYAQGTGIPAVSIAGYRSVIAGLVLLPMAWRHRTSLRVVPVSWLTATAVGFGLMTLCFVGAMARTEAANAIILESTAPVWVFLLAPIILDEHVHWTDGASLLVSVGGVLVIFFGQPTADQGALALGLSAGVAYGGLVVVLRRCRAAHPMAVSCLGLLGSGLLLLPAMGWWGTFAVTGRQAWLLVALGVVQHAMPYVLLAMALRHVNAQHASLVLLAETVLNPLFTFLVLGERVPAATWVGGPLVLAGIVVWMIVAWKRNEKL